MRSSGTTLNELNASLERKASTSELCFATAERTCLMSRRGIFYAAATSGILQATFNSPINKCVQSVSHTAGSSTFRANAHLARKKPLTYQGPFFSINF